MPSEPLSGRPRAGWTQTEDLRGRSWPWAVQVKVALQGPQAIQVEVKVTRQVQVSSSTPNLTFVALSANSDLTLQIQFGFLRNQPYALKNVWYVS